MHMVICACDRLYYNVSSLELQLYNGRYYELNLLGSVSEGGITDELRGVSRGSDW